MCLDPDPKHCLDPYIFWMFWKPEIFKITKQSFLTSLFPFMPWQSGNSHKICYKSSCVLGGRLYTWLFAEFAQNSFAHQCAKTSKFCAIFTWNVSKSFRNFCTIFMQKNSTGNPSLNTGDQKLEITVKPFLTIETYLINEKRTIILNKIDSDLN